MGVGAYTLLKPKVQKYDEEVAKIGNITTYYNFSGDIATINTQNQLSKKTLTVYDILVKEGDAVKIGDTIMKTAAGEKIKATVDGEVTKIYVEEDDQVMSGSKLFDIVDYNSLQITVKVDEYDLQSIEIGKEVDVTVNALSKQVKGNIYEISKEAISSNGVSYFTAKIRLEQDLELKVGMTTEIKVFNKSASDVVLIPMDSVQIDSENKAYVYVKGEKQEAVTKYIETGISDGLSVQVKSGIVAGDMILKPIVQTTNQMQGGFGAMGGGRSQNEQSTSGE